MPTSEELTPEQKAAIAARRVELKELHDKQPPWDAEADAKRRAANLRPLSENHWMSKRARLRFLYKGWRRLIAKRDARIAELEVALADAVEAAEHGAALPGHVKRTFGEVVAVEMAAAEEAVRKQDERAATGLYDGNPTSGQVDGLVLPPATVSNRQIVHTKDAPPTLAEPVVNERICAKCDDLLGRQYFPDVPGYGDLCMYCHVIVVGA